MARYGGHRVPDEYRSDWRSIKLGEYWDWWHLGYEDGVWQTKWDYGIRDKGEFGHNEDPLNKHIETLEEKLARTEIENGQLRELLAANVRVIKEELRKEMAEEDADKRTE